MEAAEVGQAGEEEDVQGEHVDERAEEMHSA